MNKTIRIISVILCLVTILSVLSGCTNTSDSKKEAETVSETVKATADETTIQMTEKTVQLILEEQEYPTVKLDPSIDWESMYYEYLRSLDSANYSGCALIYINDDVVPELYIKSQSRDKSDLLCYITKDGLSMVNRAISDSEGFWYLKKQGKVLVNDIENDQFTNSNDDESPTELHNGISRNAYLYYFSGDELHSTHHIGRYVLDGKIYSNGKVDDGGYDYYDGEKNSRA